MKNSDLKLLHRRLATLATQLLAKGTFIPTALAMAPDGTLTTNETPITQQDDEEIAQEVLALRRTFREEAQAGRLSAYGIMMHTEFDVPNGPANAKAIAYFFEHECGEGVVMYQPYQKGFFRKVTLGEQFEEPLPENFRIWESTKLETTPETTTPPKSPAKPMTEVEAQKFIAQIPGWAESQREIANNVFGAKLDYSAESIPKLDQIIKEGWPEPPVLLDEMVLGFGSYLGETIRRVHGGGWCFDPKHELHYEVGGIKIFPFAKVRKRFLNGEEDSLGFFYSFIRAELAKGQKSA